MANTHQYSKKEELANTITHGIGVVFSIPALIALIIAANEQSLESTVSFIIYGVTMLMLYLSSTLVHGLQDGKVKNIFQIVDHSMIYLFIAGTYTPLLLNIIEGQLGWSLLWILWGVTAFGIIFKILFVKKFLYMSTFIYLAMGWMIVFAWDPLVSNLHSIGLLLLLIGGLSYTVGTIFYVWRGFPYHHAVWHVFVLAGSALHFFAIVLYV
ncbi:PAQR family membrane homeostasis protein TrhA [Tuberibacillus sp. Marseille-P3662]|uniref:PAQR family membrane homeostasis protein TrhA n=1 Tax=Tuberibacillus sp. Marseille-P3662 TaxID=1965358 RepID=UPI000A1CC9D9|nr:hemolysin III family protein [Tuberibacillus sp. Marseille-P3662]